jgi:RimJ/RimL family protein N-acetyltransferase
MFPSTSPSCLTNAHYPEQTVRVALEPYRATLASAFIDCCADPATFAFLRKSFPDAPTPAILFQRFLISSGSPLPQTHAWAIVTNERTFVGHLELKATEKTTPAEGELVVLVARGSRWAGVASAAVALLVQSPHLAPEFDSLLAVCRPSNEASLRLMRRIAFASLPDRSSLDALFFGYQWSSRTARNAG